MRRFICSNGFLSVEDKKRPYGRFSLSKKEVSSEGMKPPSEIKRVKEEEKGERVGMAGVP